jgi:hypothetical protein
LATSSLLVKGALATCSRFLVGAIGLLVKKAVSCASGLLAGGLPLASTSGDKECEIIGDLVTYLVPHGILIQVSSYRTFVLPYIFVIGFKTPERGFSQFTRNLN